MLFKPSVLQIKQHWLCYIMEKCRVEVNRSGLTIHFIEEIVKLFQYWFLNNSDINIILFTIQKIQLSNGCEIFYYFNNEIIQRNTYFSVIHQCYINKKESINPLMLFVQRMNDYCRFNGQRFNLWNVRRNFKEICNFISLSDVNLINYIMNSIVFENILGNKHYTHIVRCRPY